jgi:uncharacterized protein (TIGR03382 family)
MPDMLAHALVGYVLGRVLSWRHDRLGTPHVTAVMVGTFVPDMVKVKLVADPVVASGALGLPFSWSPLHTAGGVLLSILVGALVALPRERRRVLGLLAVGAGSHLFLDALLRTPTGRSYAVLWPLTRYRPPTPGLSLSTEPWPAAVAGVAAAAVWLVHRRRAAGD